MLRVAIADIHLSAYKDDELDDTGLPYRLSSLIKIIKKICNFCRDNDIKYIDILGDLYNDKDIMYTDSINVFKDILLEFNDITFTILSGNHDMSSIGSYNTSTIESLIAYSNVNIIDKEPKKIDDNILAIPWSTNVVDQIKGSEKCPILLSHVGISEGQLSSGLSIKTNLKMSDFSKFDLVLLGHYHKPQQIISKNVSLYYIGNLLHINWNDKNEDKRFIVYDSESLSIKSIPLKGFREFKELIIDNKDNADEILKKAAELKEQGHSVRVRKLITENLESDKSIQIIEESSIDPTNRGVDTSMSTIDKMKKYMEIKNIDDKDIKKYLNIGQMFID